MTLEAEINAGSLQVATDAYDMSVGELINIYRDGEVIVSPEYQRLFRWSMYQKSHFIESLLVGIPIPSIFVFEQPSGKWELIDGLQRVSTILEFVGILRKTNGDLYPPSAMKATRTLPSLAETSWDGPPYGKQGLSPAQQIAIKRARIGVQILRKTSDVRAKYDLFQRLNSHGSQATDQELRNCVLFMMNSDLFKRMKKLASESDFSDIIQPSRTAKDNQALMDYLTRFFVFMFVDYDKKWDIEEYLNNGLIEVSSEDKKSVDAMIALFKNTLSIIKSTNDPNILKRYSSGKFTGKVGQAGFEAIFLGVAQNVKTINSKSNPGGYVLDRAKKLWSEPNVSDFTRGGVTGTTRIQKTISFGKSWFSR